MRGGGYNKSYRLRYYTKTNHTIYMLLAQAATFGMLAATARRPLQRHTESWAHTARDREELIFLASASDLAAVKASLAERTGSGNGAGDDEYMMQEFTRSVVDSAYTVLVAEDAGGQALKRAGFNEPELPLPPPPNQGERPNQGVCRTPPPACMLSEGEGEDKGEDEGEGKGELPMEPSNEAGSEPLATEDQLAKPRPGLVRRAISTVGDTTFLIWTVFIQTAGAAFSIGLLLNVCGYGYKISLTPPSFEVTGRLETLREERGERRFVEEARQELFPSTSLGN